MLITNHVIAGAAVGAFSRTPGAAFGLGLVSHVAMDALPHWGNEDEKAFLRVAVVDGLVGLTVLGYLAAGLRGRDVRTWSRACSARASRTATSRVAVLRQVALSGRGRQVARGHPGRGGRPMPAEVALGVLGLLVVSRLVRPAAG